MPEKQVDDQQSADPFQPGAHTFRRRQAIERGKVSLAEQLGEDLHHVDPERRDIVEEGDRLRLNEELVEAEEAGRRQDAIDEYRRQFPDADIDSSNVIRTDRGYELDHDTQKTIAAQSYNEQVGWANIRPEHFTITESGQAQLTDAGEQRVESARTAEERRQRRRAQQEIAEQQSEELGTDIHWSDVQIDDGAARAAEGSKLERALALDQFEDAYTDVSLAGDTSMYSPDTVDYFEQQAEQRSEQLEAADITVDDVTVSDDRIDLSEDAQIDLAAEQAGVDRDQIVVTDDGFKVERQQLHPDDKAMFAGTAGSVDEPPDDISGAGEQPADAVDEQQAGGTEMFVQRAQQRTLADTDEPARPGGPGHRSIDQQPAEVDIRDVAGNIISGAAAVDEAVQQQYQETSPAATLFGTEARDEAIRAAKEGGSIGATISEHGRFIESAGAAGTAYLDETIPQFGYGPRVGQDIEQQGRAVESPPVGTQLRNIVVGTPEFLGIGAGLPFRATGDVVMQAEHAAGADIDEDVFQSGADVQESITHAGGELAKTAKHEPVGFAAGIALPGYRGLSSTTGKFSRGFTRGSGSTALDTGRIPRPSIDPISVGDTRGISVGIRRAEGKVPETRPVVSATTTAPGRTPIERGTATIKLDETPASAAMNPTEVAAVTRAFPDEAAKIQEFRNVQTETQFSRLQPSDLEPHIADILEQNNIPRDTASTVVKELADADAHVYGSITQRASGDSLVVDALGRPARDIDSTVPDKQGFANRVTEQINKDVGQDVVELRDGVPTVKETGQKLFDLHEPDSAATSYFSGRDQRFGVDPEPSVRTSEGLDTTTLSEQTARKGEGAMKQITGEPREISPGVEARIGPAHAGRVKDIADMYVGEHANIRNLEQRGLTDRATRARESLESWLEQWPDDYQSFAKRQWDRSRGEPQKLADFSQAAEATSGESLSSWLTSEAATSSTFSSQLDSAETVISSRSASPTPSSTIRSPVVTGRRSDTSLVTEDKSDPSSTPYQPNEPSMLYTPPPFDTPSTPSTPPPNEPSVPYIPSSPSDPYDLYSYLDLPTGEINVTTDGRRTPPPKQDDQTQSGSDDHQHQLFNDADGDVGDMFAPGWLGETVAAFAGVDRGAADVRTSRAALEAQRGAGFEGELSFEYTEEESEAIKDISTMFR